MHRQRSAHPIDQPTQPLTRPANGILAPPREGAAGAPVAARRRLLEPADLAQRIADLLSDRQAEDIVLMDIGKVSTFTDFFVIATANNPRQMNALIDSLDRDLRPDARPLHVEGTPDSGWVLIDFGDAIVHLFAPEERRYYNLEGLWAQGVSVVHIQ